MFYVRIVFFQVDGYSFNNISENPELLFENKGSKCIAKLKTQGKKKKIIIEYGPFQGITIAQEEGLSLLRNIKIEMCRNMFPISISGISGVLDCEKASVMPSRFTKEGLQFLKSQLVNKGIVDSNKVLVEDVLGLAIYEVEKSMDELHFVSQDLEIQINSSLKIERKVYDGWDEKLDIALSLLSTSNLINDVRVKFLLKIMSIEVLVSDKEHKEKDYIDIIKNISKYLKSCEASNEENMNKVKNDIGMLKIKSIGEKCNDLILKYCTDKKYGNYTAIEFFKKCYSLRSNFVHSGEIDINKIDENDNMLKNLVIDVLLGYQQNLFTQIK